MNKSHLGHTCIFIPSSHLVNRASRYVNYRFIGTQYYERYPAFLLMSSCAYAVQAIHYEMRHLNRAYGHHQ